MKIPFWRARLLCQGRLGDTSHCDGCGVRHAAWAVFACLLLWVLAYAAVPFILKSQLEKIGSEKLGRQLTVGALDFKSWSLELTIHDLAIAKARQPGA